MPSAEGEGDVDAAPSIGSALLGEVIERVQESYPLATLAHLGLLPGFLLARVSSCGVTHFGAEQMPWAKLPRYTAELLKGIDAPRSDSDSIEGLYSALRVMRFDPNKDVAPCSAILCSVTSRTMALRAWMKLSASRPSQSV